MKNPLSEWLRNKRALWALYGRMGAELRKERRDAESKARRRAAIYRVAERYPDTHHLVVTAILEHADERREAGHRPESCPRCANPAYDRKY